MANLSNLRLTSLVTFPRSQRCTHARTIYFVSCISGFSSSTSLLPLIREPEKKLVTEFLVNVIFSILPFALIAEGKHLL